MKKRINTGKGRKRRARKKILDGLRGKRRFKKKPPKEVKGSFQLTFSVRDTKLTPIRQKKKVY
jgi:hypothetical protein